MNFYKHFRFIVLTTCAIGCTNQKPNPDYAINPNGLLNLNQSTIDDFDSKMAKNEYHLVKKNSGVTFDSYSYEYNKNSKSGIPFYNVVKYVNSNGENKLLLFMKGGNENYSTLKDLITGLGYKFTREETFHNQTTFVYILEGSDQMIKITPPATENDVMIIRVIYFRREPLSLN